MSPASIGIKVSYPIINACWQMISNECSQPRWNSIWFNFLQVLLDVVGETGLEDSQSWT